MIRRKKVKQEKRYKKSIYAMLIIELCGMLGLSGCVDSPEKSDNIDIMENVFSHLEPSPPIYAENPQEENMADLLQKVVTGAMVQIQVGDAVGSGVLWNVDGDKLVIITAAHLFTMGNGIGQVTFADGWRVPILEYTVTDTDLAFLFVEWQKIPEEHLAEYNLIRTERAEQLQNGEGVILMGSGSGVAADAYEGSVIENWIYVEDFAQYMIWVDAVSNPGMSGGGLFDYEGNFLGILCGTNDDGETVVLPFSIIYALYGAI